MRVFLAFELPEDVAKDVKPLQEELLVKGVRPTTSFHLTLYFFDELSDDKVESIKNALSDVQFDSFEASLDNVGCFPTESYIRVVWLGLEPKDKIIELQKLFEAKLNELGFKSDKDFLPHITLARVKFLEDKKSFVEKVKSLKIPEIKFKINKIKLFKSTLTKQGPIYEQLLEIKGK